MKHQRRLVLLVAAAVIVGVLTLPRTLPPEPVWKGVRLSEWLDLHDASERFETNDGRHPSITDAAIDDALDHIGTNALPYLKQWLVAKPSPTKQWFNTQLSRVGWVQFRFEEDIRGSAFAEAGFIYYGTRAQPLLPWLVNLSKDSDAYTRMVAYEAAFFTRPEKECFLNLADRALADMGAGCEELAAQWMIERFPEEALQRDLKSRFPQYYRDDEGKLQ